jgi:tetratricopeptide (TPR) repeat protein
MKKLVLVLALIGVLTAGGVLGYSLWKRQTPESYYQSGKRYFDNKKYSEATISLLNAVRKDARHRDARYYLALSYLNQRDAGRAIGQFKALLEIYPDDVDTNLQLGNLYLAAAAAQRNRDFFSQAQDLAQKVLSKNPQNVQALILSATASAGLQDLTASVNLLEKAIDVDPKNTTALIGLARARVLQKDYPEGEKALLKAREVNPKDKSVLIALAQYYRAFGTPDQAEAVLKDVSSLYPSDPVVYSQIVDFYLRSRRFDEVEKVLRDAQAADATNPGPTIVLANFLQASNRGTDARKLLVESKSKFPKSLDLAVALATNLIPDKPEEAKKQIDEVINMDPKNPIGPALLGEFQFRTGQLDAAQATLGKETVVNSPLPQIHFILGNIAVRKGQIDQAQDHYQKSLAVNPSYTLSRTALAEVYASKGRAEDARVELRKVLELQPGNIGAVLLKAKLDTAEKKWGDAEQELSTLIKAQPDNPAIHRQMGVLDDTRGNSVQAEKEYLRALELAPTAEQSFRDLTSFYLRSKQPDRAIQRLNSVPDAQKQAFHYELLGAIAAASGKLQDAESDYKQALQREPNRTNVEMLLFNLYLQNGRPNDGMKILDELAKRDPNNSGVSAMKGTVFETQGKLKEAEENYLLALKGDPNNDVAGNNLAYLLAEQGRDLQTALGYAQGVRRRHPEDPSVADTLGWVYYKLGNLLVARDQAEFATSKIPGRGLFQYHLGMIYQAANDRTKAKAAFEKAVASKDDFKEKSLADSAIKNVEYWRHLVTP